MVPDSGASDSGTELDTMMRVSIHESIIPAFKEWCQVLWWSKCVDMMTPIQLGVPSKTILEDVYGFTPDVESLPVVVSSLVVWRRLLGTKTDKKLGVRNVPISLVE
jgi:hypothetical protein